MARLGPGVGLIPTAARSAPTTVPVNVVPPFFAGILTQGQAAVPNPGAWTGTPSALFDIEIRRSGVTISTDPGYIWTADDVAAGASAMTLRVSAENEVGTGIATSVGGVTIAPPLALSGTPGSGIVGAAYSFTPSRSGGHASYSYALTGTLPAGLTFNTSTGAITGTPISSGTASGLNITVTDGDGLTASLGAFSIAISSGSAPGQLALNAVNSGLMHFMGYS